MDSVLHHFLVERFGIDPPLVTWAGPTDENEKKNDFNNNNKIKIGILKVEVDSVNDSN